MSGFSLDELIFRDILAVNRNKYYYFILQTAKSEYIYIYIYIHIYTFKGITIKDSIIIISICDIAEHLLNIEHC